MDKKEVMARFLKSGNQLDSSSLEYFSTHSSDIETFLDKIKTMEQPSIITTDLIKKVFGSRMDFEIIKKFSMKKKKEKLSVMDYSNSFSDMYKTISHIITERIDGGKILSINKSKKATDFVIICMIREKNPIEKTVLVEDLTGQLSVVFGTDDYESLHENDVVGMECNQSGDNVVCKKIIWPDLPIKKSIDSTNSDTIAIFISDLHMDSNVFDNGAYEKLLNAVNTLSKNHDNAVFFILGGISPNTEDIDKFFSSLAENSQKIFIKSGNDGSVSPSLEVTSFESPVMVRIGDVNMLLCQGDGIYSYKDILGDSGKDVMVNILKRRNLAPLISDKKLCAISADTIIDTTPTIFASGSFHSAESVNYKGVTVLTTGDLNDDPTYWSVSLKTREINKVVMS